MLLREQIRADLIVLDFRYFDAGMDWLSAYHARVDCFRKIVTQHLVNHRLNLLGCVMNIPLESRLFMPLHFCLHRVHGFHFGEQSVLGLKDIPQAHSSKGVPVYLTSRFSGATIQCANLHTNPWRKLTTMLRIIFWSMISIKRVQMHLRLQMLLMFGSFLISLQGELGTSCWLSICKEIAFRESISVSKQVLSIS